MSDLQLGERVSFACTLQRQRGEWDGKTRSERKLWAPVGHETRDGIIVGVRTLSNGRTIWNGHDAQSEWRADEHFTALLVAFDLHRRPVFVRPEHVQRLDTPKLLARCSTCGGSGWYGSRWHNPSTYQDHVHCRCELPCRACAVGAGFELSVVERIVVERFEREAIEL